MYEFIYAAVLIILGIASAYIVKISVEYLVKKIEKWSKKRINFWAKNIEGLLKILKIILMSFVFLIFLFYGLKQIKENPIIITLSDYMISFLPKIFLMAAILIVGIILARIVGKAVEKLNYNYSNVASFFVQLIIILATMFTLFEYVNIKATAFFELFRVIIYTVGLTLAISFGIAIGFSIKDRIGKVLKKGPKKRNK